MLQLLQRFKLT